jgi:hypothetical protein
MTVILASWQVFTINPKQSPCSPSILTSTPLYDCSQDGISDRGADGLHAGDESVFVLDGWVRAEKNNVMHSRGRKSRLLAFSL